MANLVFGVEALLQLAQDVGQLEVEKVGIAGLEIVHERCHRELLVVLGVAKAIDSEVDHGEKRVGVHAVVAAGLADRLVAKAKAYAKGAEHLQQVGVIADEGNHLVLALVHLHLFHITNLYMVLISIEEELKLYILNPLKNNP